MPKGRRNRLPHHGQIRLGGVVVSVLCACLVLPSARGQMAEDVFKNVQVLKGITVSEFMDTMGFFAAALGYNCTNCHGEGVMGNWAKYAEDVPEKRMARHMIQVENSINKDLFGGRQAVTCYTCHRGGPSPKIAPSLLEQYSELPPDDPNEVEISRPSAGRILAVKAPEAGEILDRYVQGVGVGLKSFSGRGHYDGFDTYHGKVPFEVYARNSGQRSVIVHTQNGDSVTTWDGSHAWIMGPDKPVPVLQLQDGGDRDGIALDSALAFPAGLKQALTSLRTGFPTTLIDDRGVQIVQGNAGDTRVLLFFDKQTGLLSRVVRFTKTVVGPVPTQIDYSDYREVAGVKMPFQWRLTWTGGQSTYTLEDVQPNVEIDAARFSQPIVR